MIQIVLATNFKISEDVSSRFENLNLKQLRQFICEHRKANQREAVALSPDDDSNVNTCPATEEPICGQCRDLVEPLIEVYVSGQLGTDDNFMEFATSVCVEQQLGTEEVCRGSVKIYFVITIFFIIASNDQ